MGEGGVSSPWSVSFSKSIWIVLLLLLPCHSGWTVKEGHIHKEPDTTINTWVPGTMQGTVCARTNVPLFLYWDPTGGKSRIPRCLPTCIVSQYPEGVARDLFIRMVIVEIRSMLMRMFREVLVSGNGLLLVNEK